MGAIKYWSVMTVYLVNFGLIIELNVGNKITLTPGQICDHDR